MATALGVFADREEQMRVLAVVSRGQERVSARSPVQRRKPARVRCDRDGVRGRRLRARGASSGNPNPGERRRLVALSGTWSADTHPG